MTEPTLDTLTQRLDRLERQVRWWRFVAIAILLIVVVVIFAPIPRSPAIVEAQRSPAIVEAQRIVIRGSNGKVRAVLGAEKPERGWPRLPASLMTGEKQHEPLPELGFFLYDAAGVEVARLTDWGGAGAFLGLADQEQQGLAALTVQRGLAVLEVSAKEKGLPGLVQDMERVVKRAEREHWIRDDPRWESLPSVRATSATVKAIGGHGPLISGFEATGDKGGGLLPDVVVALYGSGIARPGLYLKSGPA